MTDTTLAQRLLLPISESMFVRKTDMMRALFAERSEAADALDAKDAEIARLTAANKALEAERDDAIATVKLLQSQFKAQQEHDTAIIDRLSAELAKARKREELARKLEPTVEFVARMAWRTDPPNSNAKLTDGERLSAIKFHPVVKHFGQPHIELAEREALPSSKEPGQ